jgi:hypothetical protein
MLVDGRFADSGRLGDRVHAQPVDAAFGDQPQGVFFTGFCTRIIGTLLLFDTKRFSSA